MDIFVLAATDPEVTAAIIAASASLALGVLTGFFAYATRKRERQRELYGKAFKVALAWREMLYRVRRRAAGETAERDLVDRFHELQELIDYYQGWIASESPYLARSYCRLVADVKKAVAEPVRTAWQEPSRRTPAEGALEDDVHPDCTKASEAFLFDVRWHLSIFVPLRVVVAWRNRRWLGGPA